MVFVSEPKKGEREWESFFSCIYEEGNICLVCLIYSRSSLEQVLMIRGIDLLYWVVLVVIKTFYLVVIDCIQVTVIID